MYRLWSPIIEPLLKIVRPKSIVEIGSDRGYNTRNLLEFCQQTNAKLQVVDPLPKYDISAWQKKYGNHVVFYVSLSLDAIQQIDQLDVVLIDGDHNWYTVFNELKLIEKRCAELSQPFPLIILHDIGWPYGRRDLYYNPEIIPAEYLKPWKQKGMKPGSLELVEKRGLNPHLCNATLEKGPRNGVLTAVENFIEETEKELELLKVFALFGFGMIIPTRLKEQNEYLRIFLDNLSLSPVVDNLIEQIEKARVDTEIDLTNKKSDIKNQSRELEKLSSWIEELDVGISALLNSKRWKVGSFTGGIYSRMLFKPLEPMPENHIKKILSGYANWKKKFKSTNLKNKCSDNIAQLPDSRLKQAGCELRSTVSVSDSISVDIIVCVHNALNECKQCLESIKQNTSRKYKLYVVNDGSDESTSSYLHDFTSKHDSCVLIENRVSEGYTRAANKGLRASTADYVVLLNSDTIVSELWIERLLECGESGPYIGIIGPLSNAASWQSVPERFDPSGDWAVNSLPDGYSANDMAQALSRISEKRFPRVPFINGFCFVIKRAVISTIGYLDEESFPNGYGEENDYCLRAVNAGFELAVADHAYIYHAKSKSYTHQSRKKLAKTGMAALKRKHSSGRISEGVDVLRNEPVLVRMRQHLKKYLEAGIQKAGVFTLSRLKILFLLPCKGGGGGAHSVVQEAHDMLQMGVFAQVAVPQKYQFHYLTSYPNVAERLFYFFDSEKELICYTPNFEVVVATIFSSVKLLHSICQSVPNILPAYYIQDYEPWFFESDSELQKEAKNSYTLISDMLCFAKTDWLCETVKNFHNVMIHKVRPSLDKSLYYPAFRFDQSEETIRIVAMVRPKTPRRAPVETMRVLKFIKDKYKDKVSITIFGSETDAPDFLSLPHDFKFENRGVLVREEVSEILRHTDLFIDLSKYQAFGRTGLEAMACGCTAVLPGNCGTSEYAIHQENALLVNTSEFNDMVGAVEKLINDRKLRKTLAKNAILTASTYSMRGAVISELSLFYETIQKYKDNQKTNEPLAKV